MSNDRHSRTGCNDTRVLVNATIVVLRYIVLVLLIPAAQRAQATSTAYGYTENTVKELAGCFEIFRVEQGRYPTQAEGLHSLVTNGLLREVPTDRWGRSYVYAFPGRYRTNAFDLFSLGEDGKSASQGADRDDINNWDKKRSWCRHYNRIIQREDLYYVAPWAMGFLILTIFAVLFARAIPRWRSERSCNGS